MGGFMKERLMWQLRHRIDRDLALARVSLTVAVCIRETDLLNVQRGKRLLAFHSGKHGGMNSSPAVCEITNQRGLYIKLREGALVIRIFAVG
jgi:hypothetical protein